MIPEFLTAKPTTNRNASEVPVGPEGNSSNQLPNQDTFQKALQEQTEQRNSATVTTRSDSVTDKVRPESTSQKTPSENSNVAEEEVGSSKAQSIATEELQKRSGTELADSASTGKSDAASDRVTKRDSADDSQETRSDRQESTGSIRRVDPENHSAADDVPVQSPVDIPVPNGNPSGTASAVQAEFLSIDDTDLGTLPSLIRHPPEDVSVNQFSGEVIPENNNLDQVVGTLSDAGSPETLNVIDINGELRPFLNDTLIPDSNTGGAPAEISAIDSSLVETVKPNHSQAGIYGQASVDELLPIPPLPSLRSDVATTVPLVLKVPAPNHSDTQTDGEIQNVARPAQSAEESAGSQAVNDLAVDSLLTENNPEVTRPQPEIIEESVSEQSSEEPPQILPSLIAAHPRDVERTATEEQQKVNQRLGKNRTDRRTLLPINDITAKPTLSIAPRDAVTEQRPADVVTVSDKSLAPAIDSDVNDEPLVAFDRSGHRGNARVHDQTVRGASTGKSLNEGQSAEQFTREPDHTTSDKTTTEVARQTARTIDRTGSTQASETNGRAIPVTAEYSATTANVESIVQPDAKEQAESIEPIASDVPKNHRQSEQHPSGNPPYSPAASNSQWISTETPQQPPAVEHPNDRAVASLVGTIDVGAVTASIEPELQANNASASSNVQMTVATTNLGPSTASVRQNVVRAPAVPMEIQDAVSAIQEATNGDSHIRVRLNPRQLGNMLVDVSRTDNGVVARLEVESAAARVAVLETLLDLQQSLSRSGASVDRIEVVLTETRAESGRQESGQSQQGEQQSLQERQSPNQQQARDEQNRRREQNQSRNQRDDSSQIQEESTDSDAPEQLDIKL